VRILIDYRPALRQRTGVGQYVHELASALQRQLDPADSLVLFSSSWKDRLPPGLIPGAAHVDARIPVRALNFSWHRLEWPSVELIAGPADIAHSLHPLVMPARSAAQVVTIHDLDFLDHPERTRAEIRRDYPALAAHHAARADLVVVNSAYTAEAVSRRLGVGADRLVICRPGAPSDLPAREPPAAVGPIVFIGTIESRKNLPTLFAAYEQVVRARPAAPPLVLAGAMVEQSASILAALDAMPAIAGRVRRPGYVSDADRHALYRDASMLVLPSLDEGFGLTALEAMHVGVPVVASNRGALPEVLGTASLMVDALDAGGFSAAMMALLDSPALRDERARAGRERARGFTWQESAGRLLAAYRQALAQRRRGVAC
jgi:glycosyltransferase involved in cell wall biosynthesis